MYAKCCHPHKIKSLLTYLLTYLLSYLMKFGRKNTPICACFRFGFGFGVYVKWPVTPCIWETPYIVELICYNFEKNRAFYDKSMKLDRLLVDINTKKLRVSATPKMSSYGHHFVLFQNGHIIQLIHYNVIIYLQT